MYIFKPCSVKRVPNVFAESIEEFQAAQFAWLSGPAFEKL